MDVCLRVLKESNKSRVDSYSVRNSLLTISNITFWDCHVHIFSDNRSRNSCMRKMKDVNHPLHHLLPTRVKNGCPYTLRNKSDQLYFIRMSRPPAEISALKTFLLLSTSNNVYIEFI